MSWGEGRLTALRLGGRRWWADPWAGRRQGYCRRALVPPQGGGREARAWPRAGRCCSSRRPASASFVLRPLLQAVLAAPSPLPPCRPRGPAGPRHLLPSSCWCLGLLWVRDGEQHSMHGVGRDGGRLKGPAMTPETILRLPSCCPCTPDASQLLVEREERALGGRAVGT